MSKKSRTIRKARAELRGTSCAITSLSDPGEVIAMIPYLLGFDPHESIVVIALEGPRQRFGPCCRLDLVDDPDGPERLVGFLSALIAHHGFDPLIVVAFSDRPAVADPVVGSLLKTLAANGVRVTEAARADGARWWSYLCDNAQCCSPAGTPYDVSSSRAAAEAVLAGLSRVPDRDALRQQFEPVPEQQQAVAIALRSATVCPLTTSELRRSVRGSLASPSSLTTQELAALVVAVQDVSRRDMAWALMTRADADRHFGLWLRVLHAAPDELMAPVGGLVAFAAWLGGRGVLASHAAERVLGLHAGYSMAALLLELCDASVNPATWRLGAQGPDRCVEDSAAG